MRTLPSYRGRGVTAEQQTSHLTGIQKAKTVNPTSVLNLHNPLIKKHTTSF